jgi:hypothetical protein
VLMLPSEYWNSTKRVKRVKRRDFECFIGVRFIFHVSL